MTTARNPKIGRKGTPAKTLVCTARVLFKLSSDPQKAESPIVLAARKKCDHDARIARCFEGLIAEIPRHKLPDKCLEVEALCDRTRIGEIDRVEFLSKVRSAIASAISSDDQRDFVETALGGEFKIAARLLPADAENDLSGTRKGRNVTGRMPNRPPARPENQPSAIAKSPDEVVRQIDEQRELIVALLPKWVETLAGCAFEDGETLKRTVEGIASLARFSGYKILFDKAAVTLRVTSKSDTPKGSLQMLRDNRTVPSGMPSNNYFPQLTLKKKDR